MPDDPQRPRPRPTGRPLRGRPGRPRPHPGAGRPGAGRPPGARPRPRPAPAPEPPKGPQRHLLVRVGAAPLELQPGVPFLMGRAGEVDLTIPSQRVSRRHAEIVWPSGTPVLKDLGSQNGTSVNGKRIKEHPLRDGDELAIGPYMCTYRNAASGASWNDSDAMTQAMVGDAMAGNLEQMPLSEVLQTLEFNQKTGTLEVYGLEGDLTLGIREGAPFFAQLEGDTPHTGPEAIYAVLRWFQGQFSFSPDLPSQDPNVTGVTITGLLMEASRRQDEGHG